MRMNVMIAIRISGMGVPPILSEKTSLTFGHGTVVDIRTCMYDTRKHEKMNVSLSRKIHIIALPHGTGKACLSPAKSVTTPGMPCTVCGSIGFVMTSTAIGVRPLGSGNQEQAKENQPDDQQVM